MYFFNNILGSLVKHFIFSYFLAHSSCFFVLRQKIKNALIVSFSCNWDTNSSPFEPGDITIHSSKEDCLLKKSIIDSNSNPL